MEYELHLIGKAEDPAKYAKDASEGLILGYPVKIKGQSNRPDNNVGYHSTIKYFDKDKDHPHQVHHLARHLSLNPPDAKNTQIKFNQFKDRFGNDVNVITLHGNSADKLKEHNSKFSHMGHPSKFEWTPHISLDRKTWEDIKNSGAKTAHEAGIEFGNAELKKGHTRLKTYHHDADSAEPTIPDHGDHTSKIAVSKSEEELEKSLKHVIAGGLALLGAHNAHAAGSDLHSLVSGIGKIPGVKMSAQFNPYAKNGKHGEGQYKADIGKYSISGKYNSNGASSNHEVSLDGPKDGGPHDPDYQKAKYLKDKLSTVGTKVLERSEYPLEKGALKNAAAGIGMVAALAGAPNHTPNAKNPQDMQSHQSIYDHGKMLRAIASVESSNGKNTNHGVGGGPIHGNERAYGKYGLMPETIREVIGAHKDLKSKHAKALALKGENLHRYMQDHKGLEDTVADRHLSHLEHVIGQDPSHLGYGWLNGAQSTLNAKKQGKDINSHWHARKVREAYGKP